MPAAMARARAHAPLLLACCLALLARQAAAAKMATVLGIIGGETQDKGSPTAAYTSHSALPLRREWGRVVKQKSMPLSRFAKTVDKGPPTDKGLPKLDTYDGVCLGASTPWVPGSEPEISATPPSVTPKGAPPPTLAPRTVDPMPAKSALRQPTIASATTNPPPQSAGEVRKEMDSLLASLREELSNGVEDDVPSSLPRRSSSPTARVLDATAASARARIESALEARKRGGTQGRRRSLLETRESLQRRAAAAVMKSRCTERETRPGYPGTLPSFLSRSSQEPDTLSQDALKVASCLLWGDAPITAGVPKCDPTNRDYAAAMARVLRNLTSYRKLRHERPGCHIVTGTPRCGQLGPNIQSGAPLGEWERRLRPRADLVPYQWRTCALVANGPLSKVARNGKVIDAHDAVWRFNLMPASFATAYVGSRTTVRIFNRLRGMEATGRRDGRGRGLKAKAGETWLFWHARSVSYLSDVAMRHRGVKVAYLHASHIAWMFSAYAEARADVMHLLAPFGWQRPSCPEQMSSGVQAILSALKLCGRVNLFGFSYSSSVLKNRPGHSDGPHSMHNAHSWAFDVVLVRLLKLMELADVCTADDPEVTTKELQARGKAKGLTSLNY